jgi:hypothetical protein
MKQHADIAGAKIEQRRRIARHPFLDQVGALACGPLGADALAALADPQRQAVAGGQLVMMAGAAGNIAVSRQTGS